MKSTKVESMAARNSSHAATVRQSSLDSLVVGSPSSSQASSCARSSPSSQGSSIAEPTGCVRIVLSRVRFGVRGVDVALGEKVALGGEGGKVGGGVLSGTFARGC